MSSVAEAYDYVVGVDTHAKFHMYAIVAATTGALVAGPEKFPANAAGFGRARAWIDRRTGERPVLAAVEGTGSYGRTLTAAFGAADIAVVEVQPSPKKARRGAGKTDELDAVRAARSITGDPVATLTQPRQGQDRSDLQILLTTRRADTHERTSRVNALGAMIRTQGMLEDTRRALTAKQIRQIATGKLVLLGSPIAVEEAVSMAVRIVELDGRLRKNERTLRQVVTAWVPELLERQGVGPVTAARLLCVWSHHGRFTDEAQFASITGASPIPIGSGESFVHRLNYGGDRQANAALHTVMLTRARLDETTKAYIAKRTAQGKGKRAIQRLLKRYIARELFRVMEQSTATTTTSENEELTAVA